MGVGYKIHLTIKFTKKKHTLSFNAVYGCMTLRISETNEATDCATRPCFTTKLLGAFNSSSLLCTICVRVFFCVVIYGLVFFFFNLYECKVCTYSFSTSSRHCRGQFLFFFPVKISQKVKNEYLYPREFSHAHKHPWDRGRESSCKVENDDIKDTAGSSREIGEYG